MGTDKNNVSFDWTTFYIEFANKLLPFKNNRAELLSIIKDTYNSLEMKYPFMDHGEPLDDICPFTVFGCFNKGITEKNRIALMQSIGPKLEVKSEIPTSFDGIPILNNQKAWFFNYKKIRKPDDISNLWDLFEAAIVHADNPSEATRNAFIVCYDKVRQQHGIKWNITFGLYWIRPYTYLNLDERNRSYLTDTSNSYSKEILNISNLKQPPVAQTYLTLISICQTFFNKAESRFKSFPELSYNAWKATSTDAAAQKTSNASIPKKRSESKELLINNNPEYETRYWLYAPGEGSRFWEEFYAANIMGICWDEMGDLKQYPSKEDMKAKMKELYGQEFSYMNQAHATWQFANELQIGDIVYAKKGISKVIGRGIVKSDYIYDSSRSEYVHIRQMQWTHRGEWEHPGKAVTKILTDITPYTEYVQKLESLFISDDQEIEPPKEKEIIYPVYSDIDFLNEVFMDADQYDTLISLIKTKKNIILQGPPGVGKTFAAKRLAYSIIGKRDTSRVMLVQFHQSYSYEDFVMGYRPTKDGFELTPGPFYQFCKTAQDDNERDYFFIIDEINRGNLSKIFGELLMLIENDKRGEKLRLLYSNELFSVPNNVHIIGMMNTADRSLAMIDYALRRRFAFFDLEPAFDSGGFRALMEEISQPKFTALVEQIKSLNEFISKDESLGDGFRIGHSYLCTNEDITDDWLSAVIEFELIPLLKEYWFDDQPKIEQWAKKLRGALDD